MCTCFWSTPLRKRSKNFGKYSKRYSTSSVFPIYFPYSKFFLYPYSKTFLHFLVSCSQHGETDPPLNLHPLDLLLRIRIHSLLENNFIHLNVLLFHVIIMAVGDNCSILTFILGIYLPFDWQVSRDLLLNMFLSLNRYDLAHLILVMELYPTIDGPFLQHLHLHLTKRNLISWRRDEGNWGEERIGSSSSTIPDNTSPLTNFITNPLYQIMKGKRKW